MFMQLTEGSDVVYRKCAATYHGMSKSGKRALITVLEGSAYVTKYVAPRSIEPVAQEVPLVKQYIGESVFIGQGQRPYLIHAVVQRNDRDYAQVNIGPEGRGLMLVHVPMSRVLELNPGLAVQA